MKSIVHNLKQFDVMLKPFYPNLFRVAWLMGGVVLGMLLVYIVVPIEFRNNAAPAQLDETYQEQWVKGAAAEFDLTGNANEFRQRLIDAGYTESEINDLIDANEGADVYDPLNRAEEAAGNYNSAAQATEEQYAEPGGFANVMPIVVFLVVGLVAILASVGLTLYPDPIGMIRRRFFPSGEVTALDIEKQKRAQVRELASQKTAFEEAPVAQFMTTYMHGDNFYDDSFAIETESGAFLGECGSGIAETVGVGEIKKVTATEVWLFAQNDITTVTHILMTEHAFNNQELRNKLAPRGEPVLVQPGAVSTIETNSLRMQIRVVDFAYGEGGAPDSSFFERLTVEIAVWEKDGASGSGGSGGSSFEVPPPIITPPVQQQAPPPQQMPPPQPQQAPPQQMPPQQQPQMTPPPPQGPSMAPPQQQPTMQPPQRQGPSMSPPQRQGPSMQPPGGGGQRRPPDEDEGEMRPPQQGSNPPSPYGDTNY